MRRLKGITAVLILLILLMQQGVVKGNKDDELYKEKPVYLSEEKFMKVDQLIEKKIKQGQIPGLAVVVIKDDREVYNKYYGYADKEKKTPVGPKTLFELGSNSKAFTALGLLLLKSQGKVNLDDNVSKYLPWFKCYFEGKETDITIKELLYQNSGIPQNTLGIIQPSKDKDALEEAVRKISGVELDFKPGTKYTYSTVNYDIIGHIIQVVSGMEYEVYMKDKVFLPLGLNNTYILREEAVKAGLAQGYKYGFLKPRPYDYKEYRGNSPASMVISCGEDMKRWIMIQNGVIKPEGFDIGLIEESHVPNRSVSPSYLSSSYAMGWHFYQSGAGEYSHSGANVTYYSVVTFRPKEKLGILAMSNVYSYGVQDIAEGIADIVMDRPARQSTPNANKDFDKITTALFILSVMFGFVFFGYLILIIIQLIKRKRYYAGLNFGKIVQLLFSFAVIYGFYQVLYNLPDIIPQFRDYPWSYIIVWGPSTILPAFGALFITCILFYLQLVLGYLFPMKTGKPFFTMITLSMVSGLGNAFIIFVVNTAIATYRNYDRTEGPYEIPYLLILFFVMGSIIYIYGQKLLRGKMLTIINQIVYETRADIIGKFLQTSFRRFEEIEKGKVEACLNNDTETVSRFAGTLVFVATSSITVICCFVYLGFLNVYGLLLSLFVILFSGSVYMLAGRSARKLWEVTRDIQNTFFRYIGNLTGGFKELRIDSLKRKIFREDINNILKDYKEKRTMGDLKLTYAFIIGEFLFTFVIGFVALLFPVIFPDLHPNTLGTYIFVMLYMAGPITGVFNSAPDITQALISWNRIKEFRNEVGVYAQEKDEPVINSLKIQKGIQIRDIKYQYRRNEGVEFELGPISCDFRCGEITFITGGNGSGKSTLGKILTGLYEPSSGNIEVDGRNVSAEELGNYFSVIFSDYFLFEKLYGIDCEDKKEEIEKHLEILNLSEKVTIKDGKFSTTTLSSGQKKRLALLISYLEDKSVCLFDEWAADQDPAYRKFFYEVLLMEMKEKGKCIIAITHDDKYFHLADHLLKLEMGQMVENVLV